MLDERLNICRKGKTYFFNKLKLLLDNFSNQRCTTTTGGFQSQYYWLQKTSQQTDVLVHTSPAKGETATLRNRKRHYDRNILTLLMVFHKSKFRVCKGKQRYSRSPLCTLFC